MPRHLHRHNSGAHFLTAATFDRRPFFALAGCAQCFCTALETARQTYGFEVWAFVVMPDHVHWLVWWDMQQVPALTISKVAWAVKGKAARLVVDYLKGVAGVAEGSAFGYPYPYPNPNSMAVAAQDLLAPARVPRDQDHYRQWQHKVWQTGAGYDFNVYTPHKLREKIAYIHANPVRAGLVAQPADYRWSSAAPECGVVITKPG